MFLAIYLHCNKCYNNFFLIYSSKFSHKIPMVLTVVNHEYIDHIKVIDAMLSSLQIFYTSKHQFQCDTKIFFIPFFSLFTNYDNSTLVLLEYNNVLCNQNVFLPPILPNLNSQVMHKSKIQLCLNGVNNQLFVNGAIDLSSLIIKMSLTYREIILT